MHNPSHPGAVLADTVLRKDGGISVTEFAKALNVSRVALSRVVNQHAGVSAELAIRLAAALGTSPEVWLSMQQAYDLWHAQRKRRPRITRLSLAA
jgi:addiction module HigA family antidote